VLIFVDTRLLAIEVRHDEGNELHMVSSIPTADSLACLVTHCSFVWKHHKYSTFTEALPVNGWSTVLFGTFPDFCGTWRCVTLSGRLFHWVSDQFSSYINTL